MNKKKPRGRQDARDQQLQLALPLNAIIAHIGGNVYTENFFNAYSYQDLDGRYIATTAFAFDSARAPSRTEELCWYTDASLVAAAVASENIPVVGESYPLFSFAQDGKTVNPSSRSCSADSARIVMICFAFSR